MRVLLNSIAGGVVSSCDLGYPLFLGMRDPAVIRLTGYEVFDR